MNWFDKYMPNQGGGYMTDWEMMGSYGQPSSNYGSWANPPVQVNPLQSALAPKNSYVPASLYGQTNGSWDVPGMTPMGTSAMSNGSWDVLPDAVRSLNPSEKTGGGFKWLSDRDGQGMAGLALGGVMGLANTLLGYKQYSLARDALKASRESEMRNYNAQRNLTNSRLEDRQNARINSSGGTNATYESPSSYMDKYGIK